MSDRPDRYVEDTDVKVFKLVEQDCASIQPPERIYIYGFDQLAKPESEAGEMRFRPIDVIPENIVQ